MPQSILTIQGLHLDAGGKPVLRDVDLTLPATGMTALMGPVGTGKSSLLKWLCGRADPACYQARVQQAVYFNQPLTYRNRPPLYGQRQGQTLDQMMLHLSVLLSTNPALLCVDEPTAELSSEESARVMERLALVARGRAVLVVSHKQSEMECYADQVVLLAGGKIQETTPSAQFFTAPQTEAGRQFLGSGWVTTAGIDTPSHHLRPDLRDSPEFHPGRPAGAEGRLREVLVGQLYVYDAPGDPSALDRDAAELVGRGIDWMVGSRATSSRTCATLASAGFVLSTLPEGRDIAVLGPLIRSFRAGITAGKPLTILANGQDPDLLRSLGLLLIALGAPAERAATTVAEIAGLSALDPALEQDLWDFELSSDLERDGINPQAYRIEAPSIPYDSVQIVARRQGALSTAARLNSKELAGASDHALPR